MLNAFHLFASLRLGCALSLAWPIALYALFLAIAWFPCDPYSAAGYLSWINPSVATVAATVAATHTLLTAAPQFGRVSRRTRIVTVAPIFLALASASITYVRA